MKKKYIKVAIDSPAGAGAGTQSKSRLLAIQMPHQSPLRHGA